MVEIFDQLTKEYNSGSIFYKANEVSNYTFALNRRAGAVVFRHSYWYNNQKFKTERVMHMLALDIKEGHAFKPLTFPDPFCYGVHFTPIFPPRHRTMKAILDNIPDTITKVYVFGSSLRLDAGTRSDLDIFMVGSATSEDLNRIYRSIPEGEIADIIIETEENFIASVHDNYSGLYRNVYEGGYKIYEQQS